MVGEQPEGYGDWFDGRNRAALERVLMEQKRSIQARASMVYASVDEVPDQLVRTPLQRSIQIMKRHRDMMFNHSRRHDYRPISMIVTTLAVRLYQGEADVYSALTEIVSTLHGHAVLVDNGLVDRTLASLNLIQRTSGGRWYIANPVNPEENFADRWHEDDHARAKAFFSWVAKLKGDLVSILDESRAGTVRERLAGALGASVVSGHLGLTTSAEAAVTSPPKVHISRSAKPWKR